jgi:AcrR family transcriptional regulator
MNITDRRVVKTRESIRKAFLQLIQIKDFQQITVTELAEAANIDRKTFYLHYNSTADLLKEFETELEGKVKLLLLKNASFDIHSFFQGLNTIMMEDIGLYRHISETTSYSFLKTACKDILKATIKESFFKESGMTVEKFNVYAEYISSGIIGIYTAWLTSESGISLEELTDTAKDAVLQGWSKIVK